MSKDDSDTIHLIVGQTRLLCQDKLGKQFRNLCLKTLVSKHANKDIIENNISLTRIVLSLFFGLRYS